MNVVNLIGNLTKNPEMMNASTVCRFTIAVNEGYGEKKRTDYINIVCFGKTAENCEKYIAKGSKVAIVGKIQTGSYEKDGRTIYTTDVVANSIEFLTMKPKDEPEGYSALTDEDIPY